MNNLLEENISEQNSFIRLICGISMTSFATARLSRVPGCKMGQMMVILGAMKVAEGIYQYCPVVAMMDSKEEEED